MNVQRVYEVFDCLGCWLTIEQVADITGLTVAIAQESIEILKQQRLITTGYQRCGLTYIATDKLAVTNRHHSSSILFPVAEVA